MRVYLSALGCKLNESELEAWARQFAARGDEIVDDPLVADMCVLNTCTVTNTAASKSRSLARRVAKRNESAEIILTGCYATMSPEQAKALPNVAFVVPNKDKDRLVSLSAAYVGKFEYEASENGCRLPEASSGELASESVPHPRTRAFVKIEDGCNMACSYCIIPMARGRAQSRPQEEIVREIQGLVDSGYKEVILTGVQISDYRLSGRSGGASRLNGLCKLVRAILDETDLLRLRLTSVAPWDLDHELLQLFANPRLCRHLHLSLQSGSDTVLRRMRRPYTTEQFKRTAYEARHAIPDLAITTDVIVGFPGESDTEFRESLKFVEETEFARVHVFPFSPREGTAAAGLPLQVHQDVKEARNRAMQAVAEECCRKFVIKFIGRTLPVLFEALENSPDLWSGHTDNYVKVKARSLTSLQNRIISARLERFSEGSAFASL